MKTTEEKTYSPTIWNTYMRFSAIAIWFIVMAFAAYGGLFIHAFIGFSALTILTYLTIRQANARFNYMRKKRIKQLGNYHIGEDYMKVFDSNDRANL